MRLRVVFCVLIVAALATLSCTRAQASKQTTSLVALNYYPNAAVGSMITISFDVTYVTIHRVWLLTAIGCDHKESNCSSMSIDGVDSSPFPCNSTDPFSGQTHPTSGTCYLTISTSGADFFSYNVSFNKTGTYELTASSQLNYPGDSNNIPGSQSFSQTMTITVTEA